MINELSLISLTRTKNISSVSDILRARMYSECVVCHRKMGAFSYDIISILNNGLADLTFL